MKMLCTFLRKRRFNGISLIKLLDSENYAPGLWGPGFNHFFHSHVFELLLRLKANYYWPAQWSSMFNVDDYENQPLADAFGIVMGTSHTEPFMRATNEWNNFGDGKSSHLLLAGCSDAEMID